MLTIKDLNTSKEMDRQEMSGVTGGGSEGGSFIGASVLSPVNAPDWLSQFAGAVSSTGTLTNGNYQDDRDIMVADSGQIVNSGGNSNATYQGAASAATNFLSSFQ
jgi:hypothetical protein